MQLRDVRLKDAAETLRHGGTPAQRARGDNIVFDENVGKDRRQAYEHALSGDDLEAGHEAYVRNHVRVAGGTPITFRAENHAAAVSGPEGTLVRVENITRWVDRVGAGRQALLDALTDWCRRPSDGATPPALVNAFFRAWAQGRKPWPAFAGLYADVADVVPDAGESVTPLTERLGMPPPTPEYDARIVAVMRYEVADVPTASVPSHPFTVPTVLDREPDEHFFPAPGPQAANGIDFGRVMDLTGASNPPAREILHPAVIYAPRHLIGVGLVEPADPSMALTALRDRHLTRVRETTGRPDFGALMET